MLPVLSYRVSIRTGIKGWCGVRTPATLRVVEIWEWLRIFVLFSPSRTLPKFVVKVVRLSGWEPPMLIRPTEDSGLACVFAEKMRLTASACAPNRRV